jgi:hypothetical protein
MTSDFSLSLDHWWQSEVRTRCTYCNCNISLLLWPKRTTLHNLTDYPTALTDSCVGSPTNYVALHIRYRMVDGVGQRTTDSLTPSVLFLAEMFEHVRDRIFRSYRRTYRYIIPIGGVLSMRLGGMFEHVRDRIFRSYIIRTGGGVLSTSLSYVRVLYKTPITQTGVLCTTPISYAVLRHFSF